MFYCLQNCQVSTIISPAGRTDKGSFSNNSNKKSSHRCPAVKTSYSWVQHCSPASSHQDIARVEDWGQVLHQFLHGSHHHGEPLLLHVNRGGFVIFRDEGEDDVKPFSENEVGPLLLDLQRTILSNNGYTLHPVIYNINRSEETLTASLILMSLEL